jgi:hypothetical protein
MKFQLNPAEKLVFLSHHHLLLRQWGDKAYFRSYMPPNEDHAVAGITRWP